ncbi:hypothetical protein [Anaerovirgula multivorans]|nr:hypothetical protein [Anaerovirgula multivorans]
MKFIIDMQKNVMEILIKTLEKATEKETIEKIISIFEVEALDLTEKNK